MADAATVYADWVEARSFACKRCGFLSTNRRVVEQHLRLNHADLFEGAAPRPAGAAPHRSADPSPATRETGAAGANNGGATLTPVESQRSNGSEHARTTPEAGSPPLAGEGLADRWGAAPAGWGAVILYTDAGTWENGTARQRSVFAVWDSRRKGIVVHEELPGTTNNEAEYAGIIAALELAREERLAGVRIRSDSQLCVNQITGAWQIKEERLRPLRDRAARLLGELRGTVEWVPRGQNHAGIFLEKKYKR